MILFNSGKEACLVGDKELTAIPDLNFRR